MVGLSCRCGTPSWNAALQGSGTMVARGEFSALFLGVLLTECAHDSGTDTRLWEMEIVSLGVCLQWSDTTLVGSECVLSSLFH